MVQVLSDLKDRLDAEVRVLVADKNELVRYKGYGLRQAVNMVSATITEVQDD